MKKNYKDAIADVLADHTKGLHVSEIAKKSKYHYPNMEVETLQTALNSVLIKDVSKTKGATFQKVKNGKNGYKRGVYKLKPQKKSATQIVGQRIETSTAIDTSDEKITDLYKGKAGEFAVISELLFRGYNAGMLALDEGIDIVALKENKKFNIQVKTRTVKTHGSVHLKIKYDYYVKNKVLDTFYIVIIRYKPRNEDIIRNEFLIFHPRDLELYFDDEIKAKSDLAFKIKIENGNFQLNNRVINKHLNDFESIK